MQGQATGAGAGAGAGAGVGDVVNSDAVSNTGTEADPVLRPLSPGDFAVYNRLAEKMDYFHNHFRSMWSTLYTACIRDGSSSSQGTEALTERQLIEEGLRLTRYLEAHHSIEETHIFPLLAKKMPQFRAAVNAHNYHEHLRLRRRNNRQSETEEEEAAANCELIQQHRAIHLGMEQFEKYLRDCRSKKEAFSLPVLKEKMDSWGEVLLKHLDQEVEELGAENMRRCWTLEEMVAFPM
ncbi:hypothetical protein QBC32DRAFT_56841 [Pseudoneurospora amorphoporcata]|uniref:Hemerythrin-like domain-containing protein n=1 Tax=Pseudoneurospora amorphoporcata TaxID=241081 RepID=A0AAN6P536_9PEZI|nr:hypothetical protein QBC32DRAFT_56841 [Pseudoneurospora amorphoporcata]